MHSISRFHRFRLVNSLCQQTRLSSAWLNKARADADSSLSSTIDVEKCFIDPEVQRILHQLTGLDMQNKVFRPRRTSYQQRSHFALMTEQRLSTTLDKMGDEALHFLDLVPVKEPRSEVVQVLSKDDDISGFDSSKFVFTDITFDATDQDRTVVVREVDGTLRTATPEEHDRMNRIYYPKANRPVSPPKVFEDPFLQDALDREEHEFVLDWACWFYEPDDPAFIRLSHTIFDRIVDASNFDVLYSTRHFGQLVFYLALNGNIPPLLNHFGSQGRLSDCANLIRLQKTLHPNWRVAIGSGESDAKIVEDFIKQNARFRDKLKDLRHFVETGETREIRQSAKPELSEGGSGQSSPNTYGRRVTVTAATVRGEQGPLGDMSEEYQVKVASSGDKPTTPTRTMGTHRRVNFRAHRRRVTTDINDDNDSKGGGKDK